VPARAALRVTVAWLVQRGNPGPPASSSLRPVPCVRRARPVDSHRRFPKAAATHRESRPMADAACADRNLLFGVLALQMDFVTRDALVAAMNAWGLDTAMPLGHILQ